LPEQAAIRGVDRTKTPECLDEARPGHAEIEAATALHPDSGAWAFFMREIIGLPREMTPAVSPVIRLERWTFSPDPVEAVRVDARQAHNCAWAKPVFV
jgi:hypothetical protein